MTLVEKWLRYVLASSWLHVTLLHRRMHLQVAFPGVIQLLYPACVYHDISRALREDTTGALALLSAYQRALLIDFARIFAFFAQEPRPAGDYERFVARITAGAASEARLAVAAYNIDHTYLLHGYSRWARALYPVRCSPFQGFRIVRILLF